MFLWMSSETQTAQYQAAVVLGHGIRCVMRSSLRVSCSAVLSEWHKFANYVLVARSPSMGIVSPVNKRLKLHWWTGE